MRHVLLAIGLWGCGQPGAGASTDGPSSADDADAASDAAMGACVESGQVDPFTPVTATLALPQDKGRILACEHVDTVTAAALSETTTLTALDLTAANGYEHFIIQYVSEGPVGTPRRVTASVYVPDGDAHQVTLVAVDHGTSGMGRPCGPSDNSPAASDLDKLTLPVVSQGYAVVATDYQGMGVAGEPISRYTVGHAEALAILDGVRAMWRFHASQFDAAKLSHRVFLLGHSQGGQATLFAHQDFDASIGELLGSVSFAPAIGDERQYKYLLGTGAAPTNVVGVVLAMVLYGHAIYYGDALDSLLTVDAQQKLPAILGNDCITDLDTAIPAAEPTIGQMFVPSFVTAASACNLDGSPCPAFEPWNTELLEDEPGSFHSDAPTLILQGGEDTTVPAPFTSCIQARIAAQNPGAPDLACLYATATHPTIVVQAMVDAIGWMHSVAGGSPPLFCPQIVPLPAECLPI
jgi:pimeloyl-ACP methyl ester carboxylesterase